MLELDKIYNEDCLIGMKRIPDASIDCIICDLPYGTTRNAWDSILPLDLLWEEYKRITKSNAAIVLFTQQPFTSVLVLSNLKMFKYEWIWEKEMGTGHLNSKFAPLKKHENILIFSQSSACFVKNKNHAMIYNPQMIDGKPYKCKSGRASSNYDAKNMTSVITENNGLRYPCDIIKFQRDKEKIHPTQKPVDLVAYFIRTYSNKGDIILDNCIGSGTTAIACIRENRHFIGFEKDETYWKKSLERIQQEQSQIKLL